MSLGDLHKREYGRILASLIRIVGDFDAAEDALQDAFAAALAQWPTEGVPANPAMWLIFTAKHKAIDRLRRQMRGEEKLHQLAELAEPDDEEPVPLDTLRLIFTCCHPALATEAQVALTLRTVCGLETDAIARMAA